MTLSPHNTTAAASRYLDVTVYVHIWTVLFCQPPGHGYLYVRGKPGKQKPTDMVEEVGNNPLQVRVRCYSVGQMPPSLRAGTRGPGRLRTRLKASSVGLEELILLRQTQGSAVEQAKAMLMANLPPEDTCLQAASGGGAQEDTGGRLRACSMDAAVARALALKAKVC